MEKHLREKMGHVVYRAVMGCFALVWNSRNSGTGFSKFPNLKGSVYDTKYFG